LTPGPGSLRLPRSALQRQAAVEFALRKRDEGVELPVTFLTLVDLMSRTVTNRLKFAQEVGRAPPARPA